MRDVRMRGFKDRRSVADALAIWRRGTQRCPRATAPIAERAGRAIAADIPARVAVPHFARAAMNGHALAGESTSGATPEAPAELFVVGEVRAGGAALSPSRKAKRPASPRAPPSPRVRTPC